MSFLQNIGLLNLATKEQPKYNLLFYVTESPRSFIEKPLDIPLEQVMRENLFMVDKLFDYVAGELIKICITWIPDFYFLSQLLDSH